LFGFPGETWYNYSILKGFPFFGSQGKRNICLPFLYRPITNSIMLMKGEGKDEDQTIAGQSHCETAGRRGKDKGGYHYS
jgi:hypothetical protein